MADSNHSEARDGGDQSRAFDFGFSFGNGMAPVGRWGFAPFFAPPLGSGRTATTPVELWLSLFPTAPLFGLKWAFAGDFPMSGAQANRAAGSAPRATAASELTMDPHREQARLSASGAPRSLKGDADAEASSRASASEPIAFGAVSGGFATDVGARKDPPAPRRLKVTRAPRRDAAEEARKLGAVRVTAERVDPKNTLDALKAEISAKPRRSQNASAAPAPKTKPAAAKPAAPNASTAARAETTKLSAAKPAPAKASATKPSPAAKPAAAKPAAAKPAPAKTAPKTAAPKTAAPKTAAPKRAAAKPAAGKAAPKSAGAKRPRPAKKPGVPFATYDAAPPHADDLTRIKGVGAKLAAILNDRGVYTFDQVAKFDAKAYAWLDETLGAFKGRGQRDDWAGQADGLRKA
ncbi:MAG: hypothetical protein AAGM38_15955 [Pseudomonadota bacterium]